MDLPKHLQPDPEKPLEVDVPILTTETRVLSAEHIERCRDQFGLTEINPARMRAIAELGIHAKGIGVLQTIHGSYMITREAILKAIDQLSVIVNDTTGAYKDGKKRAAAQSIGYLAGQLSKINKDEVGIEQTVAEVQIQEDKTRRQSFQVGAKIVISQPVEVEVKSTN